MTSDRTNPFRRFLLHRYRFILPLLALTAVELGCAHAVVPAAIDHHAQFGSFQFQMPAGWKRDARSQDGVLLIAADASFPVRGGGQVNDDLTFRLLNASSLSTAQNEFASKMSHPTASAIGVDGSEAFRLISRDAVEVEGSFHDELVRCVVLVEANGQILAIEGNWSSARDEDMQRIVSRLVGSMRRLPSH